MPDAKLTDLEVVTTPSSSDKFYIVNNNLSKSVTLNTIAQNLPSIITTGNANISGDIVLESTSKILINGQDYSTFVYDEFYDTAKTSFTPSTGTGVTVITGSSDYGVLHEFGHTTIALSSNAVDRIYVKVPDQSNYVGYTISFIQLGTACIELSAGPGVTIGSLNSSLSSAGQYSKIDLTYIDNQLYTLTGDLSATS